MFTVIITLLIVAWVVGPTRGVGGGLVGGFVGTAVGIGMARMAAGGDLAVHYTPATLAKAAVTLGIVAAVLALVVPYAAGFAALGWGVGAILAAIVAPRTGQVAYVVPLVLHLAAAVSVLHLARWSAPLAQAPRRRARGARRSRTPVTQKG